MSPHLSACVIDGAGNCSVHDHGTPYERTIRYGLCEVHREPLDFRVTNPAEGEWAMSAICPAEAA